MAIEPRRAYADGPYGQTHYRFAGTPDMAATPLLCMHPSPLSGIVYDQFLLEIGRDRYALAPDTPGFGGSDAPPMLPEISDYAHAMWGFLDSLGIETVDLLGYHTGSLIAVDMACRQPSRVRRIVMISAPLHDEKLIAEYAPTIDAPPLPFEAMLSATLDRIRKVGRGMFRDSTDERYWAITLERMRRYKTTTWGHRAAFRYDFAGNLPKVEQPILVLNPEDDLFTHSRQAEPLIKNGRIHDLPGWTHGFLDAHTEETAALVRGFLDSQE
jgi:pimeloyl-ACP methyl ester carboxylesterase